MNNSKDYSNYKFQDFLTDDFFIDSHKREGWSAEDFWSEQIKSGKINVEEFNLAEIFLKSLTIKKAELSTLEFDEMKKEFARKHYHSGNKKISILSQKKTLMSVAASIAAILIIGGVYFANVFNKNIQIEKIASSMFDDVVTSSTDVLLRISDQKQVYYIKEENPQISFSSGVFQVNNENTPISNNHIGQEVFNQLSVPSGKRSTLILSDGSKLWLNEDTRVVFPNSFNQKQREIYVDGEVYIDVTKDEERTFVLKTQSAEIKVHGTSFNVKAHENHEKTTVVLIEGSVSVSVDEKEMCLEPNEMFSFENGIAKVKKVDPDRYVIWKTGVYYFKSKGLAEVFDVLSEYYGVTIIYDKNVANRSFSGKLNFSDNVEQMLGSLNKILQISWKTDNGKYYIESQ